MKKHLIKQQVFNSKKSFQIKQKLEELDHIPYKYKKFDKIKKYFH